MGRAQPDAVWDGINDAIVNGRHETVNPAQVGTEMAAHDELFIEPQASGTVLLRLCAGRHPEPLLENTAVFADATAKPVASTLSSRV